MHMKFSLCLALLASLWSSSCTSAVGVESYPPVARTASSAVPVAQGWQSVVESLASHPEVLNQGWAAARRVFPVGCFQQAGIRELHCPEIEGIVRVSVDPGPRGIIDLVLEAPADCQQIYVLMSRHLGQGVLENGDKCTAEWSLKRWVKRANANISVGRKDPGKIYLQFAVEQGP